ncbi:DUF2628 domain-containing protein [Pragia fontium]|uniref:DUF2628 domain-containing protein n=2 Tax=Pragia fontium TaxID=82985 RepID=A0AAJ4WCY4_9GAMM|nr:DUF2628 domain-containing protein [Pragia fontium]AKJ40719.1 membrane protein [Pragia fontium]SFD31601.1 Protein of unknown function [Pragia fontium DSM 5563 = ATCC 49100]SUB84291.1 Protein of uncharacterised function (DUF2628) [Pragia fontium]VEJ57165.1 Protein of uncharacterised function (DUF2628) [Pragia fontium]GKX63719.1 membrane protein [Pragia fontium]
MDNKSKYSEKWQTRFAFFDQYGAPDTPEHKAAIKAEKPMRRILFNMNFIAFFFGFIYFFVLGLWKKNLVLLGITIGIGIVLAIIEVATGFYLPRGVDMGINIACAMMWSMTANYAYYLKEVKGSDSWNPFEGMRLV